MRHLPAPPLCPQARNQGLQEYGTAVFNPSTKTYEQLLDECGVVDCKVGQPCGRKCEAWLCRRSGPRLGCTPAAAPQPPWHVAQPVQYCPTPRTAERFLCSIENHSLEPAADFWGPRRREPGLAARVHVSGGAGQGGASSHQGQRRSVQGTLDGPAPSPRTANLMRPAPCSHANRTLTSSAMPSGRWYPSAVTLSDGKVLVVGGTNDSGKAGYGNENKPEADNPTYVVYDVPSG